MICSLDRKSFLARHCFNLKTSDEIVAKNRDLLPSGVGSVVVCRDRIEGPFAFEFGDGLFLCAAASHEFPEKLRPNVAICGNGRIFKMTVGGIKEVKLVIFSAPERDSFAINHDTLHPVPAGNIQLGLEIAEFAGDMVPSFSFANDWDDPQPFHERHLDGVKRPSSLKEREHVFPEEGAVHSEFKGKTTGKSRIQISDQISHELSGPGRVMNVAGSIFNSQNMPGLCQMSDDRIVGMMLSLMRIESPKTPGNRGAGCQNGTVDVDRESAKFFSFNRLRNNLAVDLDERLYRLHGESFEPARKASLIGQMYQAAETLHEWISAQMGDMIQSFSAYQQQCNDEEDHIDAAVVSSDFVPGKHRSDAAMQADGTGISPNQFQTSICRDVLWSKFDRKVLLDLGVQIGFSISHLRWPPCGKGLFDGIPFLPALVGHFKL